MSIEILTEDVRARLALAGHEGPTPLRIIDDQAEALKAPMTWALQQVAEEMQQHAADRAALVAQLEAARVLLQGLADSDFCEIDHAEVLGWLRGRHDAPTHAALVAQARGADPGAGRGAGRCQAEAMSIEKLTDEERVALSETGEGDAALRIIDRLTEALAAAGRLRDSHHEAHVSAEQRALTAEDRVRELDYANGQRQLVIDALERKLAAADERYSHGKLTRTEAEQRVLDACATLGPMKEWAERVWAAELARREAKR